MYRSIFTHDVTVGRTIELVFMVIFSTISEDLVVHMSCMPIVFKNKSVFLIVSECVI